ncbi:MAG TPA: protein kinase, partial [Pyrinomonadaceae bacterium]|nr:protein kinase [Pyrinomonadaceae bacterium]
MTIAAGTKLSRYEIRSKLGEGGMGEVYRARDEKLNRDVAIKVLPASYSQDSDRLRRFEQEAQATGTLNHPNILAVYDVGTHHGAPYIVAELLEGQELRHQLYAGALAPQKAIEYAQQIAQGLAAAHERGIVHRDLKPENLFITTGERLKILDFGLAKLRAPRNEVVSSEIDTRKQITDPGTVMGTVGYMSPEQVRGQPADHRSDIFSFGSILYEMLTGQIAFRRETMAETMTAILKEEPPELSETNPKVSSPLEKIVRRCLDKKPARRFQTASDLAFALESLSGSAQSSGSLAATTVELPAKRSWPFPWLVASILAIALLSLILFGALYMRRTATAAPDVRFLIQIPDDAYPVGDVEEHNLSFSPDGQSIAFVAYQQGQRMIWLRPLAAVSAQTIAGTDGAFSPFWSPDSLSIAFFADGKLKRLEVASKSLQTICNLPETRGDSSGSWGSAGTIVFSQDWGGKIYRVPATGGTPSLIVDSKVGAARRWIRFLPDGKRFIFYKDDEGSQNTEGIYSGSIDSAEIKRVIATPPAYAQYVNGYLLYPREGSLMAQAFDEKNLRPTGEPAVVIDRLPYFDKSGWCEFSASDTGRLVYMTEDPKKRIVWLDRAGREMGQLGEAAVIYEVRLAADAQKALVTIADPRTSSSGGDIWIQDLTRG